MKTLSTCWTSDGGAFGVATSLKVLLVETFLGQAVEGLPAGRLGAGGELEGGCRAHAAATNFVLAIGGCLMFVGLAACSGLRWLALLCNCRCNVGQRRRAALAATTRWDDLACSGL